MCIRDRHAVKLLWSPVHQRGTPYYIVWILSFFRTPSAEVTERISTKLCHMFGNGRAKVGVPPHKTWSPKTAYFGGCFTTTSRLKCEYLTNQTSYRQGNNVLNHKRSYTFSQNLAKYTHKRLKFDGIFYPPSHFGHCPRVYTELTEPISIKLCHMFACSKSYLKMHVCCGDSLPTKRGAEKLPILHLPAKFRSKLIGRSAAGS